MGKQVNRRGEAGVPPDANHAGGREPAPPINVRFFVIAAFVGFVFTAPFAAGVVWLLSSTGGRLTWPEMMTLYACIALCAGITFSAAVVNATGRIEIPRLGITLTGGAAIGIAIVLLLNWFVRPAPPFAIISPIAPGGAIQGRGPGISRMSQVQGGGYLVEFAEGVDSEWIEVREWDAQTQSLGEARRLIVDRYGLRGSSR